MRRVRLALVASSMSALVITRPALAGEAELAETLFREAHALLKEQRYAEACSKFAESERHDPASGTLLALAYCEQLAGLFASARQSYIAAAELASKENQLERRAAATDRAASLEASVSTLTIQLSPSLLTLPSLRVVENGHELKQSDWSRALPIDGGVYTITVSAADRTPWSKQITIAPEHDHPVLTVPELAVAAESTRAPSPAAFAPLAREAKATQILAPVQAKPSEPPYWTTPRVLGWTAVSAGAASGLVATYFVLATRSAEVDVENAVAQAENQTGPTGTRVPWDASGHVREVDGRRDAALARGFGVASGTLLIGGAALVFFGAETHEHVPTNVSLAIIPGAAQLGYSGSF